uniref:Uncharacterized protein n=1 Tax=Amphiprion percula TaxID=161767 RepID=A0A3P8TXV1_AMPPE
MLAFNLYYITTATFSWRIMDWPPVRCPFMARCCSFTRVLTTRARKCSSSAACFSPKSQHNQTLIFFQLLNMTPKWNYSRRCGLTCCSPEDQRANEYPLCCLDQ